MSQNETGDRIKQAVKEKYGELAEKQIASTQHSSCCGPSQSCCKSKTGTAESAADLYADSQIANLPDSVTDIALGCGNPTAIAELRPGEIVLDLGSGGGIDCFLAARQVGEGGRVIGLDMTPKMLDLARANAKKQGLRNVEFQYGYIEDIPLPDNSVDVIISNCVINLSADKDAVFREAFRVLKPGGRLNVSDIVTQGELPAAIAKQLSTWPDCVSGALDEQVYLNKMRKAGFTSIEVVNRKFYDSETMAQDEDVQKLVKENGLVLSELDQKIASITLKAYKR
jgi:arsenite methyltransferase